MIRVLAGEKRGMQLRVAPTSAVRPTTANARQVLFDILGPRVAATRWLDLYAGSGAVGLEALSRGASECAMVESARRCLETIHKNIEHVGYRDRCRVVALPVEKALKKLAAEGRSFDMIFLDPPYSGNEAARCLLALGDAHATLLSVAPESLVIAQFSSRAEIRRTYGALVLERERKLGDTCLCFFRRQGEAFDAPIAPTEIPSNLPIPSNSKIRTLGSEGPTD